MQTNDSNSRSAGLVTHPEPGEWMAFMYDELPAARRRELGAHLASCPDCGTRLRAWRSGADALDHWELPPTPVARSQWRPVLKWAAAVALILALGFFAGRQTAQDRAEIATLKSSVAQLTKLVESQSNTTNLITAATDAANSETKALLADFVQGQAEQRAAEQQSLKLALARFDARIAQLRSELETVAVNTETGFEATKENLTRMVAYSMPEAH